MLSASKGGLTDDELRAALEQSLQGRNLRRVLINRRILPDSILRPEKSQTCTIIC